jgi:hypothetical protein
MPGYRRAGWIVLAVAAATVVYVVAEERNYIRDFGVYQTAARRALAGEPLYRAADGLYQYKYWPFFALMMAPFAFVSHELGKLLWFGLSAGLLAWLIRISIRLLPDRRMTERALVWWTLVMTAKFMVRELSNGQTNALMAVLVLGALVAARQGRGVLSGALLGLAVFVKPYALVTLPWLAATHGRVAVAAACAVIAAGLLLPAGIYGWQGNLALLADWYGTVSSTTTETLAVRENMSLASIYAKWLGPGSVAFALTVASSLLAGALAVFVWWRRDRVRHPDYLDVAVLMVLVPLLSPQGWDYVLLLATPALVLLIDRFRELSLPWRVMTAAGFLLTSLMIFDVYRRTLYVALTEAGAITIGGILLAVSLARLRVRSLA